MRDPVRVHVRDWALTVAAVVLTVFLLLVLWYANSLRNAVGQWNSPDPSTTQTVDPGPEACVGELCPGY